MSPSYTINFVMITITFLYHFQNNLLVGYSYIFKLTWSSLLAIILHNTFLYHSLASCFLMIRTRLDPTSFIWSLIVFTATKLSLSTISCFRPLLLYIIFESFIIAQSSASTTEHIPIFLPYPIIYLFLWSGNNPSTEVLPVGRYLAPSAFSSHHSLDSDCQRIRLLSQMLILLPTNDIQALPCGTDIEINTCDRGSSRPFYSEI